MAEACPSSTATNQSKEVHELLLEVDALAKSPGTRWAEKRGRDRRKFHTDCQVYYLSPAGAAVRMTTATTRDISMGGVGFVSQEHFPRKTALLFAITVSAGNTRRLTGEAAYSRRVKEGWYLTGMKFGPVEEEILTQAAQQGVPDQVSPTDTSSLHDAVSEEKAAKAPRGKRERALTVLAAASASRTMSRDTIAKVVTLAMSSDHAVRRAAIPVLMQVPGSEGALALIELLDDPNATVQAEAADALGRLRTTRAIEPLRDLLRHKDDDVALRAAEALGRMNDQSGIRVVARILRGDTSLNRRAARALGAIVGHPFRATTEGVAAARCYLKAKKVK